MTTVTATVYCHELGDAGGAARLLRARLADVVDGSPDTIASADLAALAAVLETAATDYEAPGWAQRVVVYPLVWATSGAHDAVTKAAADAWLNGSRQLCGAAHGSNGSAVPKIGLALQALINQL